MQGTNTGEFLGMPATGKTAVWTGFVIRRIENGMVVEEWDLVDMYGMLIQLGVLPAPGPK